MKLDAQQTTLYLKQIPNSLLGAKGPMRSGPYHLKDLKSPTTLPSLQDLLAVLPRNPLNTLRSHQPQVSLVDP